MPRALVEQLKAQGGVALAGDDLKKFLEGATFCYENAQFATQMRLEADGRLARQSKRRIGGSGAGTAFDGDWRVNEQNL